MFLRQLTVKNIRSLEEVTIDFTSPDLDSVRNWTCLLGENGCGKSTILRATALLLAGSNALPEIIGDVDRWIRNGCKHGRIDAILETQTGQQRPITLELERGMHQSDLLRKNASNLFALDEALRHSARNYFVAGYGVSRRLSSGTRSFEQPEVFKSPRSQAVGTLFSGDAVLRSLDSWAMDLEYQRGARGTEIIKTATNNLLPDVKFHRVDRRRRHVIFKTKDGLVPLQELSDGYQNVAAWCGDLLFRITESFRNYKNPLHARGLLLLDEVDLHLHPIWQRQLVATLRERLPNFQFLTTTHSPLTAQQAGQGELYILRREKLRPTLFHYEQAPNLLRVEQIIVSPVFGLNTGVSVKVEEVRKKEKRGEKLAREEKVLLKSVPRRRVDENTEREKIALLQTVNRALAAAGATKPPMGKAPTPAPLRPSATQVIKAAMKK